MCSGQRRLRQAGAAGQYQDMLENVYGVEHRAQVGMLEWSGNEPARETPAMGVDLATRSRTGA